MMRIALALVIACSAPTRAPEQPIAFDHALHLGIDLSAVAVGDRAGIDGKRLACVDCHAGAERGEHAGLPALRDCLRCHVRPQGKRDARVRELAKPGPFAWVQVTRNPGHVYAPHRAHVGIAKIACSECHGDVASWREPPTKPNPKLSSMSACIACHRREGAPTTCGTCHR